MASLTTTFSPASTCFTPVSWYSWSFDSTSYAIRAVSKTQDCKEVCYTGNPNYFVALPTESRASCMPSGWSLDAIYSPGLCPKSYNVACSTTVSINTLVETIGICCPAFFSCLEVTGIDRFPASLGCRSRFGDIKFATQQIIILSTSLTTITLTAPDSRGSYLVSTYTAKNGIVQSTSQSADVTVTATSNGQATTVVAPKSAPEETISTTDILGDSAPKESAVALGTISGTTITAAKARRSTLVTTITPGGGVVKSLVLETQQLPDGQLTTVTSFAIVDQQTAASAGALEFQTLSTVTRTTQLDGGSQTTSIVVLTNTNIGIPPHYSTYQAQYLYAYGVQIRFQSTSRSDVGARGLSIGAKIGIGVAIPLFCFAILMGGFLIRKRRQRLTRAAGQTNTDRKNIQPSYSKPELDADAEARRHELGEGARMPAELDDTSIMPEL